MRTLFTLLMMAGLARAEGERAGDFDYYVMSLSWSPNWCALQGDARHSPQCEDGAGFGWVLHGLWPQYETGWPSYCRTQHADPTRAQTGGMVDIMGTSGAAWHQWEKHGRCSGLSARDFFNAARRAYSTFARPDVFRRLPNPVRLPASVVEAAILQENPQLQADMVTIICKSKRIQEARICLTGQLKPRICGPDVSRDCTLSDALMDPVR